MKKKVLITTLAVAALTVGVLAAISIEQKEKKVVFTQADDTYTINAFEAYRENPGASVSVATTLGNEIVLSTNGVAVEGEKITVAPGGYIEVARNAEKEHLNALDGLKTITTDFEGRIAYSYRDQVVTYDDAVDGNFTFPEDYAPSFFKLYNDSAETREVNSLGIAYNCSANEESFIKGHYAFSTANGVITSDNNQATMNLIKQTKKGILSYKANNTRSIAKAFMGPAVGLSSDVNNWYKGDATYTWAVFGAKGHTTFAQRVNGTSEYAFFDGDNYENHLIKNFVEGGSFYDFTLKFDIDNHYFALYQGDYVMAVDTNATSVGDKIGFICEYSGMQFKDIILQSNINFNKDPLQRRTKGQFDVQKNGQNTIYEGTKNASWHYFNEELPSTGTVVFDYYSNSFPSTGNYADGLLFAASMDQTSVKGGKSALFGAAKATKKFSATSSFETIVDETVTNDVNWMTKRTAAVAYDPAEGKTLHIRLDYDLTALKWELYTREDVNGEWVKSDGVFQETDAARDMSGLKYLGIKTSTGHAEENFNTTISNLVVNGVAW